MQDKIKKIPQYISFYTTNPDTDWKRMFLYTCVVVLLIIGWSLSFYTIVKKDIQESEVLKTTKTGGVVLESETSLQSVISVMEEKKIKNMKIIEGESASYSVRNPL